MDLMTAVVLGIVEGVTEFLPVSSTGHLIVVSDWLGIDQDQTHVAFEVIIQLAAILAVIANYRDKFTWKYRDLWQKIFVAFLPLAAVGFVFSAQVKAMFSVPVVATMFIVGGVVFLVVEYFYSDDAARIERVEHTGYRQALWIGIAQVFALIPGTSRAGATIIGALCVGLNRKASAEFSFLLALPVMLAATGYEVLKHYRDFNDSNLLMLGVGFVTSFVIAAVSMRLFIRFLASFTFVSFGIYRIFFGLLLLGWWYY